MHDCHGTMQLREAGRDLGHGAHAQACPGHAEHLGPMYPCAAGAKGAQSDMLQEAPLLALTQVCSSAAVSAVHRRAAVQ